MKRFQRWLDRKLVFTGRGRRRSQREAMPSNERETQKQIADRECQQMEEHTLAVRRPDNQDQTTGGEQTLAVRRPDNQDLTTVPVPVAVFQQMLQTQHQVSGSGNIPINNPTDCTINIYQSKDSAHTPLQSGQSSGDTSENQPSTSQQPTTQGAVSHSQTPECSTSDVRSQAAAAKCKDALKLHYRTTGSYVQVNPWYDVDQKRIPVIYTRLQLANAKGDLEGTLMSYEDILVLKTEEGDLIKIAVLSGLAGRGKSTLFDKIAYDWVVDRSPALQKYELVFLLKMSYLEQASDLIDAVFDQLTAKNIAKHIDKGALQSYIEKNADKVLILLDGFDELKTTSLSKSSFGYILKLLSRKSFRGCTVLVSTRPSHFHRLVTKELVREPFTHVEVLGFDRESIEEYVRRYYSDEPDKAKGLLERIGSFGNLSTLAKSPMLLLLMCLLWREDSALPETMSRLYQSAIEYIANRKEVSEEEMSGVVVALGKVGLRGLLSPDQKLTFKESDFEQSVLDIALKVGILTRQRVCKRLKPYSVVQFIHKTFQEFCAAAYLREMLQANTEEFHNTLNEIMWKNPLDFEYLLRFCCGDNEACTLEILKVFQERHQKNLSFDSKVGQLALHCYFEGQCKCLPPEEVMHSFLINRIFIENLDNDSKNSVKYFVEQIKDSGNADVSELHAIIHSRYVPNIVEAFSGLPNLVALYLSGSDLGGTAALWGKQLGKYRALKELHLSDCRLDEQDMVLVAELLSGLPNLARLDLSRNDMGGTTESWCKQLGQCKALQDLNLSDCELNGQDTVHIGESLTGLPNLVKLKLSYNDLAGTAASWGKQLGQCKTLQELILCGCKLNGQNTVHIGESLTGLPNLVKLKLSYNDLAGTAASWGKQLGQCKTLQELILCGCKLNGQDTVHIGESLRGLLNLVRLHLSQNDLGGTAESLCKQLGQCKALQHLNLDGCSLNGQDMVHVAESLTGLPNLVRLDLSFNILGGTAALWCKQLGQCKALQDLDLSDWKLNGQDMVHVAESLRGLPNLVRLYLIVNDMDGTTESLCKQLGKFKALQELNLCVCALNGQAVSLEHPANVARLHISFCDPCSASAASIIYRYKKAQGRGGSGPKWRYVHRGRKKTHIETFKAETNVNVCH